MLAGVVMLAAATTATTPTQCLRLPEPAAKLPPNYVIFRTDRIVSPYELAERFYGQGYLEYKIRNANKDLLTKQGLFPAGKDVLIPPRDDSGLPVDLNRATDRYY